MGLKLFSGSKSTSYSPQVETTTVTGGGDDSITTQGDITILDGGAIENAFSFADSIGGDAFDLGQVSVKEALGFGERAISDTIGFAEDVQQTMGNTFGDALGFADGVVDAAVGSVQETAYQSGRNVLDAADFAVRAANETTNEKITRNAMIMVGVVGVAMVIFAGMKS